MTKLEVAPLPGFHQVWLLDDPVLNQPFRAAYELGDDRLFTLTGYNLAPPPTSVPRLRHGMGGAMPQDIVWPQSVMPPFVSDRVLTLFHEHQITGWDSFPVEIRDKRGAIHTTYHRLMMTAAPCGPIDWTRGMPFDRTEVPLGR